MLLDEVKRQGLLGVAKAERSEHKLKLKPALPEKKPTRKCDC